MTLTERSSIVVRRLENAPPAAAKLLAAQGWNFTTGDLETLHELGGGVGAFAERDDRLVGYLSFVDSPPVRWVGNVVVDEAARGQGVGSRLVEACLGELPTVGLYSVERAVGLYRRLGFVGDDAVWMLTADKLDASALEASPDLSPRPAESADLRAIARFDAEHVGFDRTVLLSSLIARFDVRIVHEDDRIVGYGVAKPYGDITEIGPLVASSAEVADTLLSALIAASPGPYEVGVHAGATWAMSRFEQLGLRRAFRTLAMFRGPAPDWHLPTYVATAGMEKS